MEKSLIEFFNLIAIAAAIIFPFLRVKRLGHAALIALSLQALLSIILAIRTLNTGSFEFFYEGSFITGSIPVRMDALSAWFVLVISFTFVVGSWYGVEYLKKYKEQRGNLTLHATAFLFAYTALIDICVVQNALIFLAIWEVMAISSFIIVIFEHYKKETLKAGFNYLIQSHVAVLFLTIGFIWVKIKTGSFDFAAIPEFTELDPAFGLGAFALLSAGFSVKAGFIPFHTWLPLAHPAAPAHVSGIMSGVIIKIGIYGILRMIALINADYTAIGYFIIVISVITALYGVMLAIVQHNLKRLLAYHSIENIGVIGIGIGLGCLGIGSNNNLLVLAGMGGAALHVLNHSLFKSLLFFTSGNVYQSAHTMNLESLGGLIKKMPHTAWLFLIGSLAICGLPPFNGFVSEFFIYNGLFSGLISGQFPFIVVMIFSILGLALIGGLALICFTKAFGVVFLGSARTRLPDIQKEKRAGIIPLYIIAAAILLIGLFPFMLSGTIMQVATLYMTGGESQPMAGMYLGSLSQIGWYSLLFIALTGALLLIRQTIASRRPSQIDDTWGCGFEGDTKKAQYTASSFVRTYRKLAGPILLIKKEKKNPNGLYPDEVEQTTHPYDIAEYYLIDKPIRFFRRLLNRFVFLQNGNIRSYILYGFIFIVAVIALPMLISGIAELIQLLNKQ